MTCEHAQTVASYCVQDDDGSCIRFESVALSPEAVGRILAREVTR